MMKNKCNGSDNQNKGSFVAMESLLSKCRQKAGFFIQCHPENCNAYSSRMWWDFLATVLVAKSLKNEEDVKLWKLALHKLRFLNPGICIQGVSKVMVTTFINFIWNDMNQMLKHCLMSCLFIPDIKTGKFSDELMHCWISHQLTDDQEAVHKLRELVERFILLNNQLNDKYVKLPEDIHAILHSLNTMTPWFMKKSGLGLTEPPNDELWHSVVHMELANNKLSELPLSPNCPELKVLLLQGNADLTRIPNMFFFKMPLLCILDLSYTSVRELPDSLFELEQLIALYMKGCKCFMKLSPKIGKLKKLEKLDLDGTQITHMPKEMQELTNLQSLFICFYEYRGKKNKRYTQSTIIPSEVISKLKGLNHLSIDVNPDDEQWYENVRDILPEILGLGHLLTLSLYIPHLELLKFIPDSVFEVDFRFIVGRHMQRIISSTPSTCEAKFKESGCSLKFVNGDGVPYEIKRLVGHSKALFLERHKTIQNLSEFKMMNLEQLRVFILAECREMQTVVDARQSNSGDDTFSHLLYLHVSHMRSLRSIWEGPTPPRSFFGLNLEKMAIYDCPKLQSLSKKELSSQNLKLIKGETKWCDALQWSKEEWGISCRPSKALSLITLGRLIRLSTAQTSVS
ncbi:disease resistance protein RPS2-like [Prosopis cineraria]|uniref:disease resistance protein RPS2-like n=1 Tax=Prosopis cineraria TaxID=364024 RepID=UPI00240FD6EE|nr:disease resistance protein RPS2-like [Prosopis cineraria]